MVHLLEQEVYIHSVKKALTILLLGTYLITIFRFVIPYANYKINYDFIVNELCRSRYEPRFVDCNGVCYLKKLQKRHHKNHNENSDTTHRVEGPILYLDTASFTPLELPVKFDFEKRKQIQFLKHQIYLDTLIPPPKVLSS